MQANRDEHHWNWCPNFGYSNVLWDTGYRCECNAIPSNMPFIRQSWLLDRSTDLRHLPRMQQFCAAEPAIGVQEARRRFTNAPLDSWAVREHLQG